MARGTRLWYVYHLLKGRLPFAVQAAHEKYGRIVRIAPDELSFADPDAWKSIYGYNTGANGGEMLKDPGQYNNTSGAEYSIFAAPSDRHRNLRRLLSHGFSEKALRSQEVIIQDYLDLFIRRLRDLSATGQTIDIVTWYNVGVLVIWSLLTQRSNNFIVLHFRCDRRFRLRGAIQLPKGFEVPPVDRLALRDFPYAAIYARGRLLPNAKAVVKSLYSQAFP